MAVLLREFRPCDAGELGGSKWVASPGAWTPPAGTMPGWNWTPPEGVRPRPDRAPLWVRVWYRTPFVDRYASVWMWHHGFMETPQPQVVATTPALTGPLVRPSNRKGPG